MRTIYLAITIDVEPDCSPNWVYSNPLTFNGVSTGVKEVLQPLFDRYRMVPTYLINNVVLEDARSVDVFRSLDGSFELGTHLHPEFIEPEKKFTDYAGKKGEANCCFLPPQVESAKLESITRLFSDAFGYRPLSFRAGRFSAGTNTIRTLMDLGYKVDTSVTPGITWNDKSREGNVDYSRQTSLPYWVDAQSFPGKAQSPGLFEVPVTIGSIPRYIIRSRTAWLRPFYSEVSDMIRLSRRTISATPVDQPVVLNMMFHNVEVMPGLSPYSKDVAAARKLVRQLEAYLQWCSRKGVQGISLKGCYDQFRKG